MSALFVLGIWWGVAAILLAICGYNDLGETPAPILATFWPVVLPFMAVFYLLIVLPMTIGAVIRERLA